jgi:penicillin-binding protein 1C
MAFGMESALHFEFPVACKTGTSSDFRDNWAFGYTPEFTVGVWAGNFSGAPMHQVSGVSGAAPILHDIFEHLHDRCGTTWYPTPTNVVERWIHPVIGKAAGQSVPAVTVSTSATAFPQKSASPFDLNTRETGLAANGGWILEKFLITSLPATISCDDFDASGRIRLSGEYSQWLASADNWLGDRAVLTEQPSMKILFPPPGTTLYLDPDLPEGGRRLTLRVEGSPQVQWHSDSLECRSEGGMHYAMLTAGRHEIDATDPLTGLRARTWIQVLPR